MPRTQAVLAARFETLLERLARDIDDIRADAPFERVTVVVPSRRLLGWLRQRLGRHGSILGLDVTTLHGLAERVLSNRAGTTEPPPASIPSEVHQLMLGALGVSEALAGVRRPEPVLHAAYRDLHDAGLSEAHLEAAGDALAGDPWWRRGEAVLHGYARWRTAADEHGLADRTDRVREAIRHVETGGPEVLGASHLLFYGVYDLTGAMADWLRVTARACETRIYFPAFDPDVTPAPIPETPDQYLREIYDTVLAPLVDERIVLEDPDAAPTIERFHASGHDGELTEVARRIAHWADHFDGEPPWHRVAVITRDLSRYASAARRIFRRFGVPFTATRPPESGTFGQVRGLLAACDIARDGLRRDRFVDAIRFGGPKARASLGRLRGPIDTALRQFGVVGHRDWGPLLAHIEAGRPLRLPTRVPQSVDENGSVRPPADQEAIKTLTAQVRLLLEVLDSWPAEALATTHSQCWAALIRALRGEDDAHAQAAAASLEATPLPVSREAWTDALQRRLEATSPAQVTGDGVLFADVMSARGMVFEHVFLLGLNRRRWPRAIHEDPVIPDRVRRRLRTDLGLDSIPVKERGHAEEALLFRFAADSARNTLTMSWQRSDEAGKALVASPFVEERGAEEPIAVPRRRMDVIRARIIAVDAPALPPAELAFFAAVQHRTEAASTLGQLTTDPIRRVLLQAGLEALVHRDALSARPGGWDGLVGADWRTERKALAPTRVEELLRCPWQTFVRRVLEVEPPEPVGEVPRIDPLRRGIVVHAVHEKLVRWLEDVDGPDDLLLWEDARALAERWAREGLAEALSDEPTIAPVATALLLPSILERSEAVVALLRERLYEGRTLLEAERRLRGVVTLEDGRQVKLRARADRVDEHGGRLEIADLKTGKPAANPDELLKQMMRGRRLQAPFYGWLAGTDVGWAGYEHVQDEGVRARVGLDAATLKLHDGALKRVLQSAVDLLEGGLFPLRRGRHCDWCQVSASCNRQHRPATRRLEELDAEAVPSGDPKLEAIKRYRLIATYGADA